MIEYTLAIGDVAISPGPANYTCFGLGSCIGLFIQDRTTGLSGGAHILLPENDKGPNDCAKFYNVSTALEEMLNRFKKCGNSLTSLRAKVVGGANVIGVNTRAGLRNSESVVSRLIANKIFIAALDVGGNWCRTAKFCGSTGELKVRIPGNGQCRIY
ncbi:chemotaxis protein CheD [Chryseolinea serpens]|uniref:Chemotaxis protein CheD n=1 Tax=Chryseolinea serpens TaxID=947013 RepID=A0A1M5X1T1_9BACT|nr:chemotaxis protein CheD [Chryseolinea serpens]SHH93836.1 chemotaxis protein CheD [Chryseolinea serpens]